MRDLASAGDVPAVFVVQRVAYGALLGSAWVVALDRLEAVRASMLFVGRQLYMRLPPQDARPKRAGARQLGAGRCGRRQAPMRHVYVAAPQATTFRPSEARAASRAAQLPNGPEGSVGVRSVLYCAGSDGLSIRAGAPAEGRDSRAGPRRYQPGFSSRRMLGNRHGLGNRHSLLQSPQARAWFLRAARKARPFSVVASAGADLHSTRGA